MWRRFVSVGGAATLFALYYVVVTTWTMHKVIYPLQHVPEGLMQDSFVPMWEAGDQVRLQVWARNKPHDCPKPDAKCVKIGTCYKILEKQIALSDEMALSEEAVLTKETVPAPLWAQLTSLDAANDKGLYLNFCATNSDKQHTQQATSLRWTTHGPVPRYVTLRWLLQDFGLGHFSGVSSFRESHDVPAMDGDEAKLVKRDVVARLVISPDHIPSRMMIPTLHPFLKRGPENTYLPPFFSAAQNLNNAGYHVLNATHIDSGIHMNVQLGTSDLARWLLLNHFEETKKLAKTMGLDDRQMDETLDGFANTSVLLLTVTLLATVLHCLFEFFAFRSDVEFWQKNSSLRGLSVRALFVDLLFQVIILLYLVDESTSFIVLGFSGVAIVIQLWKIRKATAFALTLKYPFFTMARLETEQQKTDDPMVQATLETDRTVMNYIIYGLVPTAVAMSLYFLLFSMHQSWWSWLVSSLAAMTYSAGFLLMTPQVIINYKLKSVEHLPWEMLTYRFINTFIDDLFACIVALPTMHRLSVFRDDVIFIICVVQRFKYSVDKKRKEHND